MVKTIIILALALLAYRIYIDRKKYKKEQLTIKNKPWKESPTSNKIIKTSYEPFTKSNIIRTIIQVLETTEIVTTTQNLDILDGRFKLLYKWYDYLNMYNHEDRYKSYVYEGVEKYKTMYYDRIITDVQVEILLYAGEDNLKELHSKAIYECFARYVENQKQQMSQLVRESAIEKRKDKIVLLGYEAKYMFKTYQLPDNGQLEAIENIRKEFFKYKKE